MNGFLGDLINGAISGAKNAIIKAFPRKELVSPLPKNHPNPFNYGEAPTPTPTPTPTPERKLYRHPLYDSPAYLANKSGLKLDEMISAAKQMYFNHNVEPERFLDTSAIESTGGKILKQFNGGPGRGPVQFEMPLPKDLIYEAGPDFDAENFDPMSATDSADLYGRLLKKGRLDRWGKKGEKWGSNKKLIEGGYYSPEEINKYILKLENQF